MSKPDASRTRIEVLMPSQEWQEVQCSDFKKRGEKRDNHCRIELDKLMSENGMKAGDTIETRVVHQFEGTGSTSRKDTIYAKEVLELPDIAFVSGSDVEHFEEYESLVHADQDAESNELPVPRIIIYHDEIKVTWGTYKCWGYDEKDSYKVLVKSKYDDFVEVNCENESNGLIIASSKTGIC